MTDKLLDLPAVLSFAVFLAITIILTALPYLVARAAFSRRADGGQTDLAGSVVFRISALHGLILALVFAQELGNLYEVSNAADREAALINDTYFDLARYDPEETAVIRDDLARYTRAVLEQEWPAMATTRALDGAAWAAWAAAYEGILALTPSTPGQEQLHGLMIHHIREISSLRRQREIAGLSVVEPLFVIAALLGVVLTSASFYAHPPTAPNIFLLGAYALYTGLVIFFIVAFANPYHDPGAVSPIGFERIYAGEIGEVARQLPP